MLVIPGRPGKDLCDPNLGTSRRAVLRVGAIGLFGISLQQPLHFVAQVWPACRAARECSHPLGVWQFEQCLEQLDGLASDPHASSPVALRPSASRSHARALRIDSCTVRRWMPSAAAVSSSDKPPK